MIQVFYDGKCGLCAREINYYRNKATTDTIDWVDVNERFDELQDVNLSLSTALKHMHVRFDDGRIEKGVNAFIAIWQRVPGWRAMARLASLPLLKQLLDILYEVFAWLRFKSYRHCRISEQASR